jgi:hypothetical protein
MVDTLTRERQVATSEPIASPDNSTSNSRLGEVTPTLSSPASSPSLERAATQQELLPSLGKLGASAFLDSGLGSGPFSLRPGSSFGGGLSLPVALLPGGRLNYEVTLSLAQNARDLPITSSVAQLINLSILNALYPNGGVGNIEQAFEGTGAAPFNVTVPARWRAQTLRVTPLALRYDATHWDRHRIRPYVAVGLGAYVTVSNQVTEGALRENADLPPATLSLIESLFGPDSPLSGALLGGQIATAPELKASGIPTGQGGIDLGMQIGGGLEWRLRRSLSTAIDSRYNFIPSGGSYNETFTRLGWHF